MTSAAGKVLSRQRFVTRARVIAAEALDIIARNIFADVHPPMAIAGAKRIGKRGSCGLILWLVSLSGIVCWFKLISCQGVKRRSAISSLISKSKSSAMLRAVRRY